MANELSVAVGDLGYRRFGSDAIAQFVRRSGALFQHLNDDLDNKSDPESNYRQLVSFSVESLNSSRMLLAIRREAWRL